MVDDATREKQTYLRTEVLEKGYDPEKFSEFLFSKKEGGEDINRWHINELKDLVRAFTLANRPPGEANPIPKPQPDAAPPVLITKNANSDVAHKNRQVPDPSGLQPTGPEKYAAAEAKQEGKLPQPEADGGVSDPSSPTTRDPIEQKRLIKRQLIAQADEEAKEMNDFTFSVSPANQSNLSELNGRKNARVRVSE